MDEKPNVIFLGVDALRLDRTSLYGYERPTTPTLQRLAQNAILCRNAFALAPFTQPASVQTFTSSRPLSHGGYDLGAVGRPQTLFARFHQAGYRTSAVSTLHWVNRYFGYGDGLDDEFQLFTLNTVAGVAIAITRNSIDGYNNDRISAENMLSVVQPVFEKLFRDCDDYCLWRIANEGELARDFPRSLLVNAGYDFHRVRKVIARHRAEFEAGPLAYVEKYLPTIPRAHEWLGREWYYCRKPAKLVSEALVRAGNRVIRPFNPSLAVLRQNRFKQYVDAEALANKVIGLIEQRDPDRPFFIWAHFMDTHLPYVAGRGRQWWRETPDYLRRLGHAPDTDPATSFRPEKPIDEKGWRDLSALYDAAVLWTDGQIGRIVGALERLGLAHDTLLVICGDHGEELGEHGNHSHYFLPYEHSVRIPLLFHRAGSEAKEVDGLVSLLDVAPTIADLAGLSPAQGWEGESVTSDTVARRPHVMFEMFYGGNCLFGERPIYAGLRTARHKYIWKEFRDPRDWQSADGNELYDIAADPGETHNLYRPDHPLVPDFDLTIARRLAELAEVDENYIRRAFGDAVAFQVFGQRATA